MRLWACLEEVGVVKEDRVVALIPPAVDGIEDRGELVQRVVHGADLVRVRVGVKNRRVGLGGRVRARTGLWRVYVGGCCGCYS